MKRNMDLVRSILLAIERDHTEPFEEVSLVFDGHSAEEVSYHVQLMVEAGLIHGEDYSTLGNYEWAAQSLTWTGHEFLDNVRDPDVWAKTKDGAKKAGSFGLDVLGALARGFIKQKLKDHTGIEIEF